MKKVRFLWHSPGSIKAGLDIVRGMKSLTEIGTDLDHKMSPKLFWVLYNQGRIR